MLSLKPQDADQPFLRRLWLVVVTIAIIAFLYKAADLLLLAFGAVLGAVLLSTVADWIAAKTPLPRGAGVLIAALLLLGAIGLMGWLFAEETYRQASQLKQQLPQDWQRIRETLGQDPLGKMLLRSGQIGLGGSKITDKIISYSEGGLEMFANFLIILVGAIFFAAEPALYRKGLAMVAPPAHRPLATRAIDDVGQALRLWLLTQLSSMILMGIMIGLGLWWSGLKAPMALGVLGGLGEFIPYVGPTLAMIPAIIVALAGGGSVGGTLLTYLIVRIVQANIITPLITRRLVTVPPGLYLFLILASGYAFGTFGMFFAGALAVAGYTLAIRLYSRETLGDAVTVPGS